MLAGRTWQTSWSSILSPYVACQATKFRPVAHTPWRTKIYNRAFLNMDPNQIHMHGKAHRDEGFTTEMLLTWGLLWNTYKSGFKSWVLFYAEAMRCKYYIPLSNIFHSFFFSVTWNHKIFHNCCLSCELRKTWGRPVSHHRTSLLDTHLRDKLSCNILYVPWFKCFPIIFWSAVQRPSKCLHVFIYAKV